MKLLILLSLMLSTSVMAQTCFKRSQNVSFQLLQNVTEVICMDDLKFELNAFGDSTVTLKVATDDESKLKTLKLRGKKQGNAYLVEFKVYSKDNGFSCFEVESFNIKAKAKIDLAGNLIKVIGVEAQKGYSYDGCHDPQNYTAVSFSQI